MNAKKREMNITDLRLEMIDVFEKVKSNEIELKQAKELANIAGKIIGNAKAQLEYNKFVGSKARIKFYVGN